jgi:subtilisin family serine protease
VLAAALGAVGLVAPARAEDPPPPVPVVVAGDLGSDAPPPVAEQDASGVAAIVETGDGGLQVVTVPAEPDEAADVVTDLERDPDVVDAFVDEPATIAATDPLRARQWNVDALSVDALPPGTDDGSGSLVAVVDTGVRASHPDLRESDGDYRVLCALGADFTLTSQRSTGNGCTDPHGHGTHVAGIVSAVAGNGIGVAGVSSARIMPVRVLDANGQGMVSRIVAGIIYAVNNHADVINLSIVSNYTTAYDAAVAYALSKGVVVVAAAGNNRALGNARQSPASTAGVIAVAATDRLGLSAPFSYSGAENVIAAPGDDVLSTTPDGYASMSGTSMAAPHVSGVLARYRAIHPTATPAEVLTEVEDTAIDLEAVGPDDDTGAGLLNAYELLTGNPAPPDPDRGVRPTTPQQIVVRAGAAGLVVDWAPPAYDGGSPLTSYDVIVAEEVNGRLQGVATAGVDPSATHAVLGLGLGLERGVAYRVLMTADNARGQGQESLPSAAVRIPAAPGAPRIGTPNAGPAAARVRWSAPASTGGSPITGYLVKAYQGWTVVRQVTVPAAAREVRLAGLTNGRAHTFVVQAVNAVGPGAHSARSIAVTPRQEPSAPWIGRPSALNDAARVYWTAPTSNGGASISAYVVKIYQGTHGLRSVTVPGTATNTLITGLGNRGYYSFTVTAKNVVGLGAPSARSSTVRTT